MSPAVEAALASMTLRQKVGQLNQRLLGWTALRRTADGFAVTEECLAEIQRWEGMGGLYAPLRADAWSGRSWTNGGILPEERAEALATVQEAVRSASPQGIGVLVSEEAPHGHQALGGSVLPVNLAAAAAWDPAALEEASRAVAAELSASGAHLALVSALDLLRDPRWGRCEETFGEDPLLASELTAAIVRGMQGEDREHLGQGGAGVVLKHLAAQGEAIGGRNGQSAHLGPHDLAEIHLPPVLAGLHAGAIGFMAAYNDIDGVPCCANRELLTELLRDRHDFDGLVMADMFAVDRLAGMTGGLPDAGRAALAAGVDLSLCDEAFTSLHELAADDHLVAAQVDDAARRVLSVKARFGLLAPPTDPEPVRDRVRLAAAQDRARNASRRLAEESLVLLTNTAVRGDEAGTDTDRVGAARPALPLEASALSHLTVIGPFAEDVPCLLGDYVAPQQEGTAVSVAGALRAALPGVQVEAVASDDPAQLPALNGTDAVVLVLGGTSHRSYDDEFAENGAIAGRAGSATGGEGVDRADISLPGAQDALLRAVRDAAPRGVPVAAVIVAGRPHILTEAVACTDAIVWAGYPGPHGGEAVTDLLLGRLQPTGRLPMTLPRHPAVLPLRYNDRQDAGVYQDVPDPVLFDVGHGLSLQPWSVSATTARTEGDSVRITATVVASGEAPGRAPGEDLGDAVLTVFGHRRGGPRVPRRRELLAFRRVALRPGEQQIQLDCPADRVFADPTDPHCLTELDIEGIRCTLAPSP
ncbi:glycoside hydrolase family 3 protein [Brachybacterium sp.]|uniref:glycoside hydrolase family 3 protein n=1 Tax=Brachybacterium sp. TaxID=1891286 RepID=UPI002ED4BDC4